MRNKKSRLLFIYLSPSTFVRADLDILKIHFDVVKFYFFEKTTNNFASLFRMITQTLWLVKEIRSADVIFGWFVDYHLMIPAFFSRLFKKPLVAVVGGTDAMNIPEWKHGVFASSWRAPIARYIYKRCDLLLPVSKSLISSKNSYTYHPEEIEFGLKKELETINAKVLPVATGYNEAFWKISNTERNPIVTTVAYIDSAKRIWIKGIDLFIRTAREVPDATFQIIGIDESRRSLLGEDLPKNVILIGSKTTSELVEIYNNSSIYLQLSRLEGFPNVLCEAMLCGCIPIGSSVFGIPEILQEEGYLIDVPDPIKIGQAVKKALKESTTDDRMRIRESIRSRFSTQQRAVRLVKTINQLS